MSIPAISLQHVTKWYGTQRGIVDVNLQIDAGEIFGFIGPNGAGKSTTIHLLLGLMRPTSGTVLIFGEAVRVGDKRIKEDVGYLSSEVHYYGDMRVRDFLRYNAEFYKGRDMADLHALAERFDVDLERRIDSLSLGNHKKVGILQAILHQPKLLILDEPTIGLDPLIQNLFFDYLQELNRGGTTIFFSSHVLSEVQRVCHRVAILKEGTVIAVENVDTLRSRTIKKVSVEWKEKEGIKIPDNAKDIQQTNKRVSFLYQGESRDLITYLASQENAVQDVTIEQPSLEEVFMHFYGKEGA